MAAASPAPIVEYHRRRPIMPRWSRFALAACAVAAFSTPAIAQTELIALDKVHQLFTTNQMRLASRELSLVSVEFRNEIGRCRDESLGARLMALEPKFDALAKAINAGTLTSVATLEQEFVVIDRALAENHVQLAASGWSLRRFGRLEGVARDLEVAAQYAARAARWAKQPMGAELQKAVDDALAAAKRQAADPTKPADGTGDVIEALAKALKAAN
jgi:hypothetical protein